MAQNLSGSLSLADAGGNIQLQNEGGDQKSINFAELESTLQFAGDDPRAAQLQSLVTGLAGRAEQLTQARTAPGLSQTRLSLAR